MKRSTTYDNFIAIDQDLSSKEQMIRFQHVCGGKYEIITLAKAIESVAEESKDTYVIDILESNFYYKSTPYIDNSSTNSPSTEFHLSGISILMIIYVICYII
jgi:hypothetical protein